MAPLFHSSFAALLVEINGGDSDPLEPHCAAAFWMCWWSRCSLVSYFHRKWTVLSRGLVEKGADLVGQDWVYHGRVLVMPTTMELGWQDIVFYNSCFRVRTAESQGSLAVACPGVATCLLTLGIANMILNQIFSTLVSGQGNRIGPVCLFVCTVTAEPLDVI